MKLIYSEKCVALELNDSELEDKSLSFESMSRGDTEALLSHYLHSRNEYAEIELIRGSHSLLILAQLAENTVCAFRFSSFEALVSAVSSLEGEPRSSLFLIDGKYILTLESCESALSLCDFGTKLLMSRKLLLHLCEQGCELIENSAVSVLKSVFVR